VKGSIILLILRKHANASVTEKGSVLGGDRTLLIFLDRGGRIIETAEYSQVKIGQRGLENLP